MAVGGFGDVHGLLAEFVVYEAPLRGGGGGIGQVLGSRGGPQCGQRLVVEGEVAADGFVVSPAEAGEDGLAVGGFGHVHGLGAEFVVFEAPLRRALLRLVLSRNRASGHWCQPRKQSGSDDCSRSPGPHGLDTTSSQNLNDTRHQAAHPWHRGAPQGCRLHSSGNAGMARVRWSHSLPPPQPSSRES